ncbi:MAG: hypothetical protein JO121_13485 [Deltaproteobacteria bacterium]|nr:hypothetical protein [Deltaproteobacteria bacterium]
MSPMLDLSAISGIVGGLKAASELVQLAVNAHDVKVIREKAIEFQKDIIAAQTSAISTLTDYASALDRIRELEKEVNDLKAWGAEKEKYQLTEISEHPQGSALVFALKDQAGSTEPKHRLCPNCYQDGRKSILQEEVQSLGHVRILHCQRCGAEVNRSGIRYKENVPRKPSRRPR